MNYKLYVNELPEIKKMVDYVTIPGDVDADIFGCDLKPIAVDMVCMVGVPMDDFIDYLEKLEERCTQLAVWYDDLAEALIAADHILFYPKNIYYCESMGAAHRFMAWLNVQKSEVYRLQYASEVQNNDLDNVVRVRTIFQRLSGISAHFIRALTKGNLSWVLELVI